MKLSEFLQDNNMSIEDYQSKLKGYVKIFRMTRIEALDMVKNNYKLLLLDTISTEHNSVKDKFNYLKETFGYRDGDLFEIIPSHSRILNLSKEEIEHKIAVYENTLKISRGEVIEIMRDCPEVIETKTKVILSRMLFYKDMLNLDGKQTTTLIKNNKELLTSNTFDMIMQEKEAKIKYLFQVVDKEDIVRYPELLTVPALDLKLKFLIMSPSGDKQEILTSKAIKRSINHLWARRAYLENINGDMHDILMSKGKFEKKYNVQDTSLRQQYKMTVKGIHELEQEYYQTQGSLLTLDESELGKQFLTRESGEEME